MNLNRRPKIRAPRVDGSYVVQPTGPLDELVGENRRRLAKQVGSGLSGFSNDQLVQLRLQARREFFTAASQYTNSYAPSKSSAGAPPFSADSTPLLVSGHQPEFFHPGVWFKNFLLSQLGQRCRGVTINLCVDNDICRSRAISVPSGSHEMPRRQMVEFDSLVSRTELLERPTGIPASHSGPADPNTLHPFAREHSVQFLPYETATWNDPSILGEFPQAVKTALKSLNLDHLILDRIWQILAATLKRTDRVGETIAQTRHLFEIEQGLENLEVPVSRVCRQPTFFDFLTDLCHSAAPFQQLYNDALRQFRRQNRIRSQSHPVPELVETDGWLEMPFWIWSAESPERGPLYIKPSRSEILFSDLDQIEKKLSFDQLRAQLSELEQQGISIRPRALMTTMFSRVFLADLFIHGIGGAKYDELTDRLIEKFYGVQPPEFLTATSTHLLPLETEPFDLDQIRHAKQQLRRLKFHPETQLVDSSSTGVSSLIQAKESLLAGVPPRGHKKQWHSQMEVINQQLSQNLQQRFAQLKQQLVELESQSRKSGILSSREHSFLLHPAALVDELHQISAAAADKFV